MDLVKSCSIVQNTITNHRLQTPTGCLSPTGFSLPTTALGCSLAYLYLYVSLHVLVFATLHVQPFR